MTERDENILAGIIMGSFLDYDGKERLIAVVRKDAEASRRPAPTPEGWQPMEKKEH